MSVRSIEMLQRYLRRLCDEAVPPEDAVLLKRFVAAQDREAFELLIARHGPMVLGTARRFVDNTHDAEDVFQAVFLSLARLAKTIRQGRTLPAWLYKTTCRIAAKVRKQRVAGFNEPPPEPCDNSDPGAGLVWQEVRQALDEELQRLPERWRSPLVLCYLSGLTRDEAARQLGWSLGTVKRRLDEGRKALRIRLEKRGIAAVGLALLDTTVLAWDMRPPRGAGTGSLETAWLDLTKPDSREAFPSEGRFLAAPSAAVKFFADWIQPVEPLDAHRIHQLLADINDATFAKRESASRALSDLGQQAKPYLEEAVKTTQSTEVRKRAGTILDGRKPMSPEQIRQLRVVRVLEWIDDDDSRKLLKTWAGGLQGALLTVKAAAALKRLEGAAKAKR